MGFFSKKTFVCSKCGKEFEARIKIGSTLCEECERKASDLSLDINGYKTFSIYSERKINKSDYEAIANHRDSILEKYRNPNGITIQELKNASANYKNLSPDEAQNIMARTRASEINQTLGALYTDKFFIPLQFEKTVVDTQDIFAVAYCSDFNHISINGEELLIAIFTNDPYLSAFGLVWVGQVDKGLFKTKSTGLREFINMYFSLICPNLQYPVQELKALKKQLKEEKSVRGTIEYKKMLYYVDNALSCIAPFETKAMDSYISDDIIEFVNNFGYIPKQKANEILRYDKSANIKFWGTYDPSMN